MDHDSHEAHGATRGFWRSRYAVGLVVFAAIALFFLLSEHRAHTLAALPYLLLAASLFLHIFIHRGHSHGHGRADDDKERSGNRAPSTGASEGRSRTTHHH